MADETKHIEDAVNNIEKGIKEDIPELKKGIIDLSAKNKALEEELLKMKSAQFITPESSKRAELGEKAKFYNAILKKNLALANEIRKSRQNDPSINEISPADTAGDFGVWIPEEWSNQIIDWSIRYGRVRPFARVIPMRTNTLNVPKIAGGMTAGYIAAANSITQSAPSAQNVQLVAKKIASLVYFDNEALNLGLTAAQIAAIENQAGIAMGYREDYCAFRGDGVSDYNNAGIKGILNSVTTNVVTQSASGGFANISVADFDALIDAVTVPTIGMMRFFISKTMRGTIRGLKDGAGQYIFNPNTTDGDSIRGVPIVWIEGNTLPRLADTASATKYIVYGDMYGLMFGERSGLSVAFSDQNAFTTDQSIFKFTEHIDMHVEQECFAVLKTQ